MTYEGESAFGPAMKVKRYRMGNGLRVLILVDRGAPVVSYYTWYRVGSRDERVQLLLAKSLSGTGDVTGAREVLAAAIKDNPRSANLHAELGRHWRKWFRRPRGKIEAVEIPPVAAIGHKEDCPTVR